MAIVRELPSNAQSVALCGVVGLLMMAACDSDDETSTRRAARSCIDEDGISHRLDFDGLSEFLGDDDALANAVGLESVEDCKGALRVLPAIHAMLEAAPSHDPSGSETTDAPQEAAFRIRSGTPAGHPGAVEQRIISTGELCSGILISPVAIVTAAHCMLLLLDPADPADGVATDSIRANYRRPDSWLAANPGATTWTCLTGPDNPAADGKCLASSTTAVKVIMHGPYVGSGDAQSDVGIIIRLNGQWEGVGTSDFVRVWADTFSAFDRFEGWGRGYNSYAGTGDGVMRTAGFGLDWYGTHHFYSIARTPRVCKGDSGGPGIWDDIGLFPYALGLWTTMDVSETGSTLCAEDGGKQRLTRLSTKIEWIDGWIESVRGSTYGCDTYSDAILDNHLYRRCW